MKPLSHHINKVKAKPHHIRKQIAFASAFVVAAVIGLVWASASLATGAFAIKGSNFAQGTSAAPAVATTPSAADLAASPAEAGSAGQAPGIEIVNAPSGQAAPAASQPSVIPF